MENSTPFSEPSGRLPSNLLDVYVQYKKDTRAIIAWLVTHGPGKYKQAQRLTIRELSAVADYIRSKAIEMPDIIAFHFRQAISARSQLSKAFRKFDLKETSQVDTDNHEFFTSRLAFAC